MNLPIRFNNYEDCLMGIAQSHNDAVYIYDKEKILTKIMKTSNCSYKEALGFFDNHINKDFGKRGPVYFSRIDQMIEVDGNE
jgi:hypothetical protein